MSWVWDRVVLSTEDARVRFSKVKKTQDTANDAEQLAINRLETIKSVQAKLDKLYNAITPLLNNLKKNPEKEYILWPNRVDKVEQFEDVLRKIYQS